MTGLSLLLIGMLLGMQHATEADHLAAVATLATRQATPAQTLRQGVAWGLGHTLTLMAFGGAVFVLGRSIPPSLEQALETAVGVMLVLLGLDVLRRLRRERIHFHAHRHEGGGVHLHAHSHRGEGRHEQSAHRHEHAERWPLRALLVGMMHGLAGSAALVVLAVQDAASVPLGLGYIVMFGLGSILGMALLSVAVALPLRLSARGLGRLHLAAQALVAVISCAIGVHMIVSISGLPGLAG